MSSVLAIGWEPELRGLLTVVIGFVVFMGSIWLICMTNMGARLAFLVTASALAGWMMLMGMVWWIYGIGLRGPDPSWEGVAGTTVIQDVGALRNSGVLEGLPSIDDDLPSVDKSVIISEQFEEEGWTALEAASPAFGQASAAASVFLEEEGAYAAGQYRITDIYDIGGERWPKITDRFDYVAFFHEPRYVVVEAAALEPVRTEPGRAPALQVIDESVDRQYVYMVRDLGARRQPAVVLTIGSALVFGALCYVLHRREKILEENLSSSTDLATTGA